VCDCLELKFLFYNWSVTWTNKLNLCLDVSLLGILYRIFFVCLFVIYVVILSVAQIIVFVVTISEA